MAGKIKATSKSTGLPIELEDIDTSKDIIYEDIDENDEWTLITSDDSPATYETDFSGGRPDDRE